MSWDDDRYILSQIISDLVRDTNLYSQGSNRQMTIMVSVSILASFQI